MLLMTMGLKLAVMLIVALVSGACMAGALLWCLRRLKAIERRRWGDKADVRGHSG